MAMVKKIVCGEVGKGAAGNLAGNLLTNFVEQPLKHPFIVFFVVAVVPLVIWMFRKKVVTKVQIKDLCGRVDEKRGKMPDDERVNADHVLLSYAESLRHNWLNCKLNPRVCELVQNRNDLDALIKELGESLLLFGASDFWEKWLTWSKVESDESGPRSGIDTRAEKSEYEYEKRSKDALVEKIVMHYADWRKRYRPRNMHLFVKWIGANDVSLVERVLRGFAEAFSGVELHVWLAKGTVKTDNSRKIADSFSAPDDGVTIEGSMDRDGGYDVVISTHFWQHHSRDVLNRDTTKLREDGLFVLLAAVSRDPANDEYVCEGFMPMNAHIYDAREQADAAKNIPGSYVTSFLPMGSYRNKNQWILYSPISRYDCHAPILSWGFPKSAEVDRTVVKDDERLTAWLLRYLQWGQKTEAVNFLRESGDGMMQQPVVSVESVCIKARAASCDPELPVSEYILIDLEYKIKGSAANETYVLPFIAYAGYEKNEWHFSNDANKTPITLHPALELKVKNIRNGLSDLMNRVLIDAGQDQMIERYSRYLPKAPCGETEDSRAWRVHTRIYETDLNDFLVFETFDIKDSVRKVYYSYFPKRRYLSAEGYERGHRMLDRYKTWSKNLKDAKEECGGVPIRFDSVTWLWSWHHIEAFCVNHDMRISDKDNDVYFHKSFCSLSPAVADAVGLSCRHSINDALMDSTCTLAKDEAFNRLQIFERVRLLACMNVHNVLLFARRDGDK